MLGAVGFPIPSIEVPPTWPMFANSGIKTTVVKQNIAICGLATTVVSQNIAICGLATTVVKQNIAICGPVTTVVKQSNTKEDTPAGVPSFVDECVALIPFRR
jgi:hypothetical protein